jgi:hypothetical protein
LKPGDLRFQFVPAGRERAVPGPEAFGVEFAGQVEAVDLLGFLGEVGILPPEGFKEVDLGPEFLVGLGEGRPHVLWREGEAA